MIDLPLVVSFYYRREPLRIEAHSTELLSSRDPPPSYTIFFREFPETHSPESHRKSSSFGYHSSQPNQNHIILLLPTLVNTYIRIHNVLRLDIPVSNTEPMQISNCSTDLSHYSTDKSLSFFPMAHQHTIL
jgi:hypothetical protein